PHRPLRHLRLSEFPDVLRVRRAHTLRNEAVDLAPQRIAGGAEKHPLRGIVKKSDLLPLVEGDDRVHRRSDDARELVLARGYCESVRITFQRFVLFLFHNRFTRLVFCFLFTSYLFERSSPAASRAHLTPQILRHRTAHLGAVQPSFWRMRRR